MSINPYEMWRILRLNPAIDTRYDEIKDLAFEGYKTTEGAHQFLEELGLYLFRIVEGNNNPHVWDKLLNRAKSHGFNRELCAFKRVFMDIFVHSQGWLNEGHDEKWLKIRRGM